MFHVELSLTARHSMRPPERHRWRTRDTIVALLYVAIAAVGYGLFLWTRTAD